MYLLLVPNTVHRNVVVIISGSGSQNKNRKHQQYSFFFPLFFGKVLIGYSSSNLESFRIICIGPS